MSSTTSPLEQRRARVRLIRGRVAGAAVAVFVAVFGFLFGQLSSGDDPGLAGSASTTTTTSQNQANDDADTGDADQSQPADQGWSSDTPSPVTTGQS